MICHQVRTLFKHKHWLVRAGCPDGVNPDVVNSVEKHCFKPPAGGNKKNENILGSHFVAFNYL